MEPRIETLAEKKLVGKRIVMSLANDRTSELWRSFMPRRSEIKKKLGRDLYLLRVYGPFYFDNFNLVNKFEKLAAVEVTDFDAVPADMDTLTLSSGLYAVFLHKGSNTNTKTFEYIFTSWLPNANYRLDDRPHFEILREKYKNGDEDSEEEIWVPIREYK